MLRRNFWIASLCLVVVILTATPILGQDFYRGKRVNLVVSFAAGGLYDSHARLLARHMGRHALQDDQGLDRFLASVAGGRFWAGIGYGRFPKAFQRNAWHELQTDQRLPWRRRDISGHGKRRGGEYVRHLVRS